MSSRTINRGEAHSRTCQTSVASPAKPGISRWISMHECSTRNRRGSRVNRDILCCESQPGKQEIAAPIINQFQRAAGLCKEPDKHSR